MSSREAPATIIQCIIIISMNNNEKNGIIWVDTASQLNSMVNDLMNQSIIGVDTESDSLFVYFEKVCLIQISTPENDYLVDPLNIENLQPLAPIFASNKIEKVFHAAEYDILCLKRDFGFQFNNLFDTMLASRILGRQGVGLLNLLKDFYNIDVNKKYQRANWGKRPLTEEMLLYASLDSHYLIDLAKKLKDQLHRNQFSALAEEDFKRISKVEPNHINRNGEQFWRYVKGNILNPQETTVFFELCKLREEFAIQRNVPPFKILNTNILIELAKKLPEKRNELYEISGLSDKLIGRYATELLHAIKLGIGNEPTYRPHTCKPSEAYIRRYDRLKSWRKEKAMQLKVESDVILPKEYLEILAQKTPDSFEEVHEIMTDIPFRFSAYGHEIIQLLTGDTSE